MKIFTSKNKNKKLKNDVKLVVNTKPVKTWRSHFRTVKIVLGVVVPIATMCGVFVTIAMNYGNNKNVFHELKEDYYSWYYNDADWEGFFNGFPEGWVDAESFHLSDSTLQLALHTSHGVVDGVATDKNLCKIGFPNDFKLVRGKLSLFGNSGEITVYDYIGGVEQVFAKFYLRVDGVIMEASSIGKGGLVIGKPIRLAKHHGVGFEQGVASLNGSCSDELEALQESTTLNFKSMKK